MKTEKLIAQILTSQQYTEDSWKAIRPTLTITEETTVREILEWAQRHEKSIREISIIKTDSL